MKVFVRSSDLAGGGEPVVVASYDDNTEVPSNAHGEGMTVLSVPPQALRTEQQKGGKFGSAITAIKLAKNWRDQTGARPEARRRSDESVPEQLVAMRELIDLVMQHGADQSKWPADAKARKAEIDQRWKSVATK